MRRPAGLGVGKGVDAGNAGSGIVVDGKPRFPSDARDCCDGDPFEDGVVGGEVTLDKENNHLRKRALSEIGRTTLLNYGMAPNGQGMYVKITSPGLTCSGGFQDGLLVASKQFSEHVAEIWACSPTCVPEATEPTATPTSLPLAT